MLFGILTIRSAIAASFTIEYNPVDHFNARIKSHPQPMHRSLAISGMGYKKNI